MSDASLPPRLTARQLANRIYLIQRRLYLDDHPICEVCGQTPSQVIHHTITRRTHLNDVSVFKACCKPCERQFHSTPAKPPKPILPAVKRHPCRFKTETAGRSCWGTVKLRHVFKGGQHLASWWLCARHRDQLICGGHSLVEQKDFREVRSQCST